MTRYEKIKDVLQEMNTADIISVHNAYCDASNHMDDYIYSMCEFDEIMDGQTPWEIARACFYGSEFCPAHDYFRFNGYANLESFDFAPDGNSGVYIEDIAQYVDDNEDDLGNSELQDILNEDEEDTPDPADFEEFADFCESFERCEGCPFCDGAGDCEDRFLMIKAGEAATV